MKRWIYSLLLLVLLAGLAGCQRRSGDGGDTEGVYQIYYMNSSMTRLEPQDYTMPQMPADGTATETDWKITQLMEQLRNVPKDLDRQSAVPDKVGFERYKLEDTVLYLYFDNNYAMMNPTREILCRAALVRTLTQAEGVDYVAIYTAEQPLMDSTGETLVKEQREVVHTVTTSLEKLVVEQLIAGPDRPGINATLPKDTKLLNVSVNENVCYLNFDASFLNNSLDVKEYIPVYSIVNSLAAVSSVNKVQIAVNGSQDVMFRDSISLNQLFERNLDYNAENEENPQ